MSYTGDVGAYFTTMWSEQAPGYPTEPPFLAPGADTLTEEHSDKPSIFIAIPCSKLLGAGLMYWLKMLPMGRARSNDSSTSACRRRRWAARGLDERRNQLVKSICDIHREDIDVCTAVQRAIRSGVTGTGGCRTSSGRCGSSTATWAASSESSTPLPLSHRRADR